MRQPDKEYIIIYSSNRKFDPQKFKLEERVTAKQFYDWAYDTSLIFERVNTRLGKERYMHLSDRKKVLGTWLFALKWSGHHFRTICIAVEPHIITPALDILKDKIKNKEPLSLISEYSFQINQGELR